MAKVICQWCREKGEKIEMIKDTKGYYHVDKCHAAFNHDKEYKRIEREKQKKLAEKIAEVYELESYTLIPSTFYPYLEDLRNDSKLFGKLGKSYKNGIPYEGISYTYEYCKEKIRDARTKKKGEFKNLMAELKYGLTIVRNNLVDAKNHALTQKKKKESLTITRQEEFIIDEEREVKYVKKDDVDDISELLE